MKKLIVLSGLLFVAFFAMNAMVPILEKESVTPMGTDMTMTKKDHMRPFKGTVSYTPSETPHVSYGVGQATHLGRFTAESHCDNFWSGEDTFIAADGSEATMSWSFVYISDDFTTGYGTWAWTRGTGRFEDTSGDGTFTAEVTTTLNLKLAGTIAY
ncbi:MAG TPA: hypothetical protein ENO05_02590 [Bacteroides sp.]|nr:hypothetical protein [Bacteroides sp.]